MAVFLLSCATAQASDGVNERLDNGEIIKDITTPENSIWAYVNVAAVVDAEPARLWRMIINIDGWPAWLPMNRRASFLSDEAEKLVTPAIAWDKDEVLRIETAHPSPAKGNDGKGIWHKTVIEEYDLVWPIRDEWVVRRYDFDDTSAPFRAAWRKVAKDDEELDGSWTVEPWGDDKSLLKYYYRVKVKKGVPRPVFRTAISLTVNSMIKSLRRQFDAKSEFLK